MCLIKKKFKLKELIMIQYLSIFLYLLYKFFSYISKDRPYMCMFEFKVLY